MIEGRRGDVFRAPKKDRHGDPINEDGSPVELLDKDGNAFIGELRDIIMGGLSASPTMGRQESSDTRGMIGCRRDLEPKLMFGDRVVIDGTTYQVISKPEWDHNHSFTGTNFNRYWVDVSARF